MSTILQQIEWEQECANRGSERYFANQDRLAQSKQGDTRDVMSFMIRERLNETGLVLQDIVERETGATVCGVYNRIVILAAEGDYRKLAYLGLKCVLSAVQVSEKNTVMKVCLDIANRLEVDLKCRMFNAAKPEYFDSVRKSLQEQNVAQFAHKQKVLMKKFGEFGLEWHEWTSKEKVQIGSRVLRAILVTFNDVIFKYNEFNRGKTTARLDTTVQFDEWTAEFERERGLLYPMYLPLKVPPRAWTNIYDGGYYTPNMKLRFVKAKIKEHREFVENNQPTEHINAVNKMQRTAWQINNDVLKVQEEIYRLGLGIGIPSNKKIEKPEFPAHLKDIPKEDLTQPQKDTITAWKAIAKRCYGLEQQRKGKVIAFMQAHKLAKEVRQWEKLYFVYTADFRGRLYCATSGLSPQGADTAKGLLRFARPVVLGRHGIKWLAIHGANTFGEDKLSYEDRVKWITQQENYIRQVVEDPISYRDFWGSADKPYQFLAFCFEWARCDYGRNPHAVGHLPIGLDGSCNGLQHFSAMLRDRVGAEATNLTPCDKPEDIYQRVADVTTEALKKSSDEEAKVWLKVGVTRKCAKRPVMTLPYGATQTSARQYIMEYVLDNWKAFGKPEEEQWKYATYLTPILWKSIGEVVIAARVAMGWLQKNVGNGYAKWTTPIGFPVYQYYKKVKSEQVRTMIDGTCFLTISDFNLDGEPAKRSQRNGIAPNFIHSIDSTHMVMTINMTKLDDFAMIHDDFGTHAGNTQLLFDNIRTAFKTLYKNHDVIKEWAEQSTGLVEELPKQGTYNIDSIKDAAYFFG